MAVVFPGKYGENIVGCSLEEVLYFAPVISVKGYCRLRTVTII